MDAVPVTARPGARRLRHPGRARRRAARHRARAGSASCRSAGRPSGTGLNAPKGFAKAVIARLAEDLDLPLTEARDHFEAQGARDALVEASGACRVVAVSLYKIASRPALDGQRPPLRPGRDPPPGPAAGLVDHAGQGQPSRAGGGAAGRRPGHRQRRRRRLRRLAGALRAERHAARHGPQPAGVDPAPRVGQPRPWPTRPSPA